MAETNDLLVGERKYIHIGADESADVPAATRASFPAYSVASSDESVVHATNDGNVTYLAQGVGVGEADVLVTRHSDGAVATVHVTVTAPPPPPPFAAHLGESV